MMKRLTAIAALGGLLLTSSTAHARIGQRGYSEQCFEDTYHEEYIPGTKSQPGRVRRWTEQKEVACAYSGGYSEPSRGPKPNVSGNPSTSVPDDNSCLEGTIIGGIGGGALGGVLATESNWIWSIPTGIIGGAMAGCQLDGG
jgi:hypothetical protein